MEQWTQSPALRVHMESVAACMEAYARTLEPEQADRWVVCGLLHDFDYEKHPTREEHPFVGVAELEKLGVDDEIRTAILGHADYSGTPRESSMIVIREVSRPGAPERLRISTLPLPTGAGPSIGCNRSNETIPKASISHSGSTGQICRAALVAN